jgi:hypothetical protein
MMPRFLESLLLNYANDKIIYESLGFDWSSAAQATAAARGSLRVRVSLGLDGY